MFWQRTQQPARCGLGITSIVTALPDIPPLQLELEKGGLTVWFNRPEQGLSPCSYMLEGLGPYEAS